MPHHSPRYLLRGGPQPLRVLTVDTNQPPASTPLCEERLRTFEPARAIRTIKSKRPVPVIAIVALEERARYEPLLLEAGADCVLELPFDGEELTSAVGRLLQLPTRLDHLPSSRWFFAGVLMRGLRRLSQA